MSQQRSKNKTTEQPAESESSSPERPSPLSSPLIAPRSANLYHPSKSPITPPEKPVIKKDEKILHRSQPLSAPSEKELHGRDHQKKAGFIAYLKERIWPFIQRNYPDKAGKIKCVLALLSFEELYIFQQSQLAEILSLIGIEVTMGPNEEKMAQADFILVIGTEATPESKIVLKPEYSSKTIILLFQKMQEKPKSLSSYKIYNFFDTDYYDTLFVLIDELYGMTYRDDFFYKELKLSFMHWIKTLEGSMIPKENLHQKSSAAIKEVKDQKNVTPESVTEFIQFLENPALEIQEKGIDALGKLISSGDTSTINRLLHDLKKPDIPPTVKANIVYAFGRSENGLQDQATLNIFWQIVEIENNPLIKRAGIEALGKLIFNGNEIVVLLLLEKLKAPHSVKYALEVFKQSGLNNKRILETLENILKSSPTLNLQKQIIEILGESFEWGGNEIIAHTLAKVLKETKDPEVQKCLIVALEGYEDTEDSEILGVLEALIRSPDISQESRNQALDTLRKWEARSPNGKAKVLLESIPDIGKKPSEIKKHLPKPGSSYSYLDLRERLQSSIELASHVSRIVYDWTPSWLRPSPSVLKKPAAAKSVSSNSSSEAGLPAIQPTSPEIPLPQPSFSNQPIHQKIDASPTATVLLSPLPKQKDSSSEKPAQRSTPLPLSMALSEQKIPHELKKEETVENNSNLPAPSSILPPTQVTEMIRHLGFNGYQAFFDQWIKQKVQHLSKSEKEALGRESDAQLIKDFQRLAQYLAMSMYAHRRYSIIPPEPGEAKQAYRVWLAIIKQTTLETEAEYASLMDQSSEGSARPPQPLPEKRTYLAKAQARLIHLTEILPVRRYNQSYRFAHKSFYEYLVASSILGLTSQSSLQRTAILTFFKQRSIQEEPGVLDFLRDIMRKHTTLSDKEHYIMLRQTLLDIIVQSREDPSLGQASSNAATILNACGEMLTGLDWHGVYLAGAHLSHAVLAGTNLSESDLRGACLHGAILSGVNWESANLQRVDLGVLPQLNTLHNIVAFAHHPIKPWLAVAQEKIILIYHRTTGEQISRPMSKHRWNITSITFSPDGQYLASASHDKAICLWQVKSGNLIAIFRSHVSSVLALAFSPDGRFLASGGADSTICLWNIVGRSLIIPLKITDPITSLAFSPDGRALAAGSIDNTVHLWDVESQRLVLLLKGHTNVVNSVAFSPDSRILASGSADKTIRLWDLVSKQPLGQPLTEHRDIVSSVAFSPNGRILASGSWDGTIRLHSFDKKSLKQFVLGYSGRISSLVFSPQGHFILSSSQDRAIRSWKVIRQTKQKASMEGYMGLLDHTESQWDIEYKKPFKKLSKEEAKEVFSQLISDSDFYGHINDARTKVEIRHKITHHCVAVLNWPVPISKLNIQRKTSSDKNCYLILTDKNESSSLWKMDGSFKLHLLGIGTRPFIQLPLLANGGLFHGCEMAIVTKRVLQQHGGKLQDARVVGIEAIPDRILSSTTPSRMSSDNKESFSSIPPSSSLSLFSSPSPPPQPFFAAYTSASEHKSKPLLQQERPQISNIASPLTLRSSPGIFATPTEASMSISSSAISSPEKAEDLQATK